MSATGTVQEVSAEDIQKLSLQMVYCNEPAIAKDPYRNLYEPLRNADPVLWSEGLAQWVVTGFDEVTSILKEPRVISGAGYSASTNADSDQEPPPRFKFGSRMMVGLNEPDHTRVRRAIQSAFAPRKIEEMRTFARQAIHSLLDAVERRQFDFYGEVAQALPSVVICEMLGIPADDRERFLSWVSVFVDAAPAGASESEITARQDSMWLDCEQYFNQFLDVSRGQDTLFARIIRAFDGEELTWPEVVANCVFLVGAGHETTASLFTNGLCGLLRNRKQLELLRSKPELVANAVEEFLRYDAPFQMSHRRAREVIEIGDQVIGADQGLLLSLGGANHDPRAYDDPHSLDIERPKITHLSFANGIHYCLGAALARLEVQEGFLALLERFPNVEMVTEPTFRMNPVFRTVDSLLLTA